MQRLKWEKGFGILLNPIYILITETRAERKSLGIRAGLLMFILQIIAYRLFGKIFSLTLPTVRHGELNYEENQK